MIVVDFLHSGYSINLLNALSKKTLLMHVVQFSLICYVFAMQTDPEIDEGTPEDYKTNPQTRI